MEESKLKINVITRCTRLDNILEVGESVSSEFAEWHVIFDTSVLRDIPTKLIDSLQSIQNTKLHFIHGKEGDLLYPQSMQVIREIKDGWIIYIDDDNIQHENYYSLISKAIIDKSWAGGETIKKIIIGKQFVNFKDFTELEYRDAAPEHTKYQHIDLAQITWHHSVFNDYDFIGDYAADGKLVEQIHNEHPEWFKFINETICYYNYLVKPHKSFVPKILYVGPGKPDLKSNQFEEWEESSLNTLHVENDKGIASVITDFKPDSILTVSDDDITENPELCTMSLEIRNKWFNIKSLDSEILAGDIAYGVAMNNMIENQVLKDYVSWFTPIYNTGKKLYRTYESLKNQTNPNWEWVLVNDSNDGSKTISIAEDIASSDPRVKLYDFNTKCNGIVGEAKYRAAVLCKGELLSELDHDDYLTPDATQLLYDAMVAYPDAGFYYTDCVEVDENWNSLQYGEGFAMGYGTYRDEESMGKQFKVQVAPNLNPKTIRHIVGVPNHIRSWRRNTYFEMGGHNRGLSIADDYELLVRTFLSTRMCRIVKLAYVQFIYDDASGTNTHNSSRRDIQRRVRTVANHYDADITRRFQELGLEDWVAGTPQQVVADVESRFGEEECVANYNYIP
tara:strand:+ start:8327 stop:10183 length:1857 start_codon:yes stop_codon:yes gene_type:complete